MSEQLAALFSERFTRLKSTDPLKLMRQLSWQRYQQLGLPSRRDEFFRYVKLRHLFSGHYVHAENKSLVGQQIAEHVLESCQHSYLVFINGYWQPDLSQIKNLPPQVIISSLNQAIGNYSAYLNNQWQQLRHEGDPFALLNAALHPEGCFIYLPPRMVCQHPLQILHITDTDDKPMIAMPRLHLFLGRQSHLPLAITHISLSQARQWTNSAIEVVLEEGAAAEVVLDTRQLPTEVRYVDTIKATLKKESKFQAFNLSNGTCTSRTNWQISLTGENCEADLNGLSILNQTNAAHANILIDHQAPCCRSRQLFKAVLNEASYASFQGKIYVCKEAQKTEAYQLNNSLLLGPYAHADSQPNLEIFADDVKASHGATIGQLNAEQLFYLRTRGLTIPQAQQLLTEAFCRQVSDKIPGWYR